MLRVFGDFESFYDQAYSLRNMSPLEYILDPRWETLGCAIAIEHDDPILLPQDAVADYLRAIKEPYCFISHNALFDACILAYKYKIHPHGLLCTMNMARATLLHEIPNGRLSLANILKHFNLPEKTNFITNMSGKHYFDLQRDPGLLMAWTGYTMNDLEGCRSIFFRLHNQFSGQEALIMDRMIRMATQPVLHADLQRLVEYKRMLVANRARLLTAIRHEVNELMSNVKFADLLRALGVEPPTKISPATGKETLAFARTDHEFMALLEHDDMDVQALMAARLGVRSTIEESRTNRFITIAMRSTSSLHVPLLPVPLKYSGAHTHRYSGDWQLNMQNLSSRKSKELRSCIVAPEGYTIVAVDAAQIEARITAWLAKEDKLINAFAKGDDVYRNFAAKIFRCLPDGVTKVQRFVGKTCILGLGFGMSAKKLFFTITLLAREQKIDLGFELTMTMCGDWVNAYRDEYEMIPRYWRWLGQVIEWMSLKGDGECRIGPCKVEGTTIIGPSGLRLYYDGLHRDQKEDAFYYTYGQYKKKIYGGKLLENVVQHLDRQHVVEAGLRTEMRARKTGIPDPRVLLNVHDENIHCVPDEYALPLGVIALEEMRRNVKWSEGLPLNAEVKMGKNFGELKALDPS